MKYGPIELVVIGFDHPHIAKKIIQELRAIREKGIIRLVDFIFVAKDADQNVVTVKMSDLDDEEMMSFGAVVGGLLGQGVGNTVNTEAGAWAAARNEFGITAGEIQDLVHNIPDGTSAIVALYEHTWAIRLREALEEEGGVELARGRLRPEVLIELGTEMAAALERAEEQG